MHVNSSILESRDMYRNQPVKVATYSAIVLILKERRIYFDYLEMKRHLMIHFRFEIVFTLPLVLSRPFLLGSANLKKQGQISESC